ncbi:MAG TPA: hypothetical protein DD671_10005 [Balneolaceae bacterium]|nr:hypothetical protein [Balneolaceae bacterium]
MATSKKTTKAETVAAHGHAELEAKVAGLEKLLEDLKKQLKEEHKALAAKCDACCEAKATAAAADPRVDAMWKWLRKDRIFRAEN